MKLTVTHKGILLVGIPLIFELALFAGMLYLTHQAEVSAERALHARNVAKCLNNVETDALALLSLVRVSKSYTPLTIIKLHRLWLSTRKDAQQLAAITAGDPRYAMNRSLITQLVVQADISDRRLNDSLRVGDLSRLKELMMQDQRHWLDWVIQSHAIQRMKELANADLQVAEEEPVHQANLQNKLKTLLGVGVFISVILSTVMAVLFMRQIARRLRVMQDNNLRLLANQPLNPPVSGSDEISELDVAFHRMTEDLRAASAREKAVQQLKERVVAMVTHDLRQPLQSVNTFLEYIDDSAIGSDEEALEFKNIAQRNVFRMKRLIDEMLDLHRLEAGLMPLNKTSFELVSAVEQAKESNLGAAKEKNISTTVEGSATIYADEHRIVQVIANLLDNAIKHAPKDSDVKVMIAREDDCVTVSVVDNGPGIPPDLRSKIFEPFQQGPDATEADRRGFGLGLAVCREIIEAHSGRIFVSSIPSGGTSFSFKIPFKG